MSFKDIKGEDSAIAFLKASLKNNRIYHAYIFCGPNGVGKRLTALNFAKALNCAASNGASDDACDPSTGSGSNPEHSQKVDACDNCGPCKKIDSLTHLDVSILRPAKEGGSISIDEIRALIKNISFKAIEGRKKICIIDGAESMKHEAANAILKTLEEPPADSVLILITENLKALFHTIVSRSQVVRFFPLGLKEIEEILKIK